MLGHGLVSAARCPAVAKSQRFLETFRGCLGDGEAPAKVAHAWFQAGTECGGGIVNPAAGKDGGGLAVRTANWYESIKVWI
ncbi:MAG TPA: hypothetical protein VIH87_09295 [Methylocella sp.]